MSIYKYKALAKNGERCKGSLIADNYKDAYNTLNKNNFTPISISRVYFVNHKINSEDLLMLFMHIDFQTKCGVSVHNAIESFINFHGDRILSSSLICIKNSLEAGDSISESFKKSRYQFDEIIIGLLKAAEKTGHLSESIENILNFLKLQTDWKNNIKRALIYPIFMVCVSIVILVLSIVFLAPQIILLVQDSGTKQLPFLTEIAINLLPQLANILLIAISSIAVLIICLSISKGGSDILLELLLKIPQIGAMLTKITMWNVLKILHISIKSGLDFMESLCLAIGCIKFPSIKQDIQNVKNNIIDGYKISESFAKSKHISSATMMAIFVGEDGNDLSGSFEHVSDAQYREIIYDIKRLGRSLSVGLTMFTGAILVFILCSLFYPIYSYIEISGM